VDVLYQLRAVVGGKRVPVRVLQSNGHGVTECYRVRSWCYRVTVTVLPSNGYGVD
jgi:hypothetical protein